MFRTFRSSLEKRIRYAHTLHELRAMAPNIAIDLDIDRANARSIARAAVYGA
jgi:hypothetical protein